PLSQVRYIRCQNRWTGRRYFARPGRSFRVRGLTLNEASAFERGSQAGQGYQGVGDFRAGTGPTAARLQKHLNSKAGKAFVRTYLSILQWERIPARGYPL